MTSELVNARAGERRGGDLRGGERLEKKKQEESVK